MSDNGRLMIVEQELADFSYIVSHDLAASFRHVAAFSKLFVDEVNGSLTQKQQTYIQHISAANAKCQQMLEQLLVYSRAQQKVLAPIRQDATLTMELAMLQLTSEVRAAHAIVSIDPLGDVFADPDLLAMAFRHLLSNAVKFHKPDVPPRISVSAVSDAQFWRLHIADNGIGIHPTHRDRAFRMFQRLNDENAFAGVGAGLAICRRVARLHGGDVNFLDCDQGACVELALPHEAKLQ